MVLGGIFVNDDLSLYIDDILNALSDEAEVEVSREELEKELKKFIEYGVPLDHAKQTLIKKFGGTYIPPSKERVLVADLESGRNSVHVICRVLHVSPKDITIKGENRTIFYGILGDESGSISFTAWKDFELEKGIVVEISNAYTKEWQGVTRHSFSICLFICQRSQARQDFPFEHFKGGTATCGDVADFVLQT